jgi:predicted NBD/HSP70 family sugar kinase
VTLKNLLATAEYADLSDADAAALANEKRHAATVDQYYTYRSLAGGTGVGIDITRRLIQSMDAAAQADVLIGEMRHSLRGERGLNVNDAGVRGTLESFAANENLPTTADDAAAIKALADSTESDAERHRLGEVRPGDIQVARAN